VAIRSALAARSIGRTALITVLVTTQRRQPAHVKREQRQKDDDQRTPHRSSIAWVEPHCLRASCPHRPEHQARDSQPKTCACPCAFTWWIDTPVNRRANPICQSSQTPLYAGLAELRLDVLKHVSLENNVRFPKAVALEDAQRRSSDAGC